jgi:hypothetical protein
MVVPLLRDGPKHDPHKYECVQIGLVEDCDNYTTLLYGDRRIPYTSSKAAHFK